LSDRFLGLVHGLLHIVGKVLRLRLGADVGANRAEGFLFAGRQVDPALADAGGEGLYLRQEKREEKKHRAEAA